MNLDTENTFHDVIGLTDSLVSQASCKAHPADMVPLSLCVPGMVSFDIRWPSLLYANMAWHSKHFWCVRSIEQMCMRVFLHRSLLRQLLCTYMCILVNQSLKKGLLFPRTVSSQYDAPVVHKLQIKNFVKERQHAFYHPYTCHVVFKWNLTCIAKQ